MPQGWYESSRNATMEVSASTDLLVRIGRPRGFPSFRSVEQLSRTCRQISCVLAAETSQIHIQNLYSRSAYPANPASLSKATESNIQSLPLSTSLTLSCTDASVPSRSSTSQHYVAHSLAPTGSEMCRAVGCGQVLTQPGSPLCTRCARGARLRQAGRSTALSCCISALVPYIP